MKRKNTAKIKLGLVTGALAFAALLTLAAPDTFLTPSGFVASARADAGSNYQKYCNRCHGADGRGQTAKGRQTNAGDLTKSRISDAAGGRLIANGKELMPGFSGNMSADEIKQLMAFVRGFRK